MRTLHANSNKHQGPSQPNPVFSTSPMDTIQDFGGFIIEYPIPLTHDAEAQTRAAARAIASRLAEIHLLAMDSNPLLHAQFPTTESLAAVREFLADSYAEAVLESSGSGGDGGGGILIARKTAQAQTQPRPDTALWEEAAVAAAEDDGDDEGKRGEIIGFATWEYTPSSSYSVGTDPSSTSANSPSPASTATTHDPSSSGSSSNGDDPKTSNNKLETSISHHVAGCQSHYLDEYARLATQARAKYFGGGGGGRECYQLSFVCIDPVHQGKGVGSALTRKVLELAARGSPMPGSNTRKGLPVYLESTLPAVRMYQRLGFKEIGSFEMEIPAKTRTSSGEGEEGVHAVISTPSTGPTERSSPSSSSSSATTSYKEICMVWYP